MFCRNCGNEIPDGSAFCGKCGAAQNNGPVYGNTANPNQAQTLSPEELARMQEEQRIRAQQEAEREARRRETVAKVKSEAASIWGNLKKEGSSILSNIGQAFDSMGQSSTGSQSTPTQNPPMQNAGGNQFCPNCGTAVGGSNFCPACGHKMN